MVCSNCGTENRAGRKFCSSCGTALALPCAVCGETNEPGDRFCGRCGSPLSADLAADGPAGGAFPALERRLVSVLFVDLVGFTTLSEGRDADDVRELLSRYFETCRRLIDRYGGTVEKFIGDAVMAVWGTPVAQEDDAERAVRTALDLTKAVATMGAGAGAPDLLARAGVLTGEAAVNLRAAGEGMVAGDLVNTASRIQSVAAPGTVLVGDATRRATEAALAYEDAGLHELKGKAEPVRLWRALRVTALRGGALKSSGLEAPFVGRDRDLRLIEDLFHSSAEEHRAILASVIGVAGIGKSRLSWEFLKYIDGLSANVYWHRGRCLSYGDGVTYFALAEMIRGRAGILEGEDPASAAEKLRGVLADLLPDAEEREWVAPRVAHLLGLEDRVAPDARDLFSAWRVFFERLAERDPVVMVIEDVQWADPSLVEFIDYLLNWSRHHPIFVLALGRPEVAERHPFLATSTRGVTTLYLEPLAAAAMGELVDGLVPGLPPGPREQILARAEGVPLYAVETVRMLLDRGLIVEDGPAYRLTGPVEALEVPETLHALIAARLDGLPPVERSLVQDAAVLGKSFQERALAAVVGRPEDEVRSLLDSLVRKELLTVQADPRSPERGQYGFLQDLVRRVAYDTLSKKDRKARHLAAAAQLHEADGAGEDEVIEVIASHYLEAWRADPDAADGGEIRARALAALTRAGEHAASLAAVSEARRYFERAAELAADPLVAAGLRHRAGEAAWQGAEFAVAREHFEAAAREFERAGQARSAARSLAKIGLLDYNHGELARGVERMSAAMESMREVKDAHFASVAAELARLLVFSGRRAEALPLVEEALAAAERERAMEVLGHALNTKAIMLEELGRSEEAAALLEHALALGRREGLNEISLRSMNNLGAFMDRWGRLADSLQMNEAGVELATRVGNETWRRKFAAARMGPLTFLGRWDEAMAVGRESLAHERGLEIADVEAIAVVWPALASGDVERAKEVLDRFEDSTEEEIQIRVSLLAGRSAYLRATGRPAEALAAARDAVDVHRDLGFREVAVGMALIEGIEAALELGDLETAEEFLSLPTTAAPVDHSTMLDASLSRLGARLLQLRGGDDREIERRFRAAEEGLRAFGSDWLVAVTEAEHAEWLAAVGRTEEAEGLAASARSAFEGMGAAVWLARLDRLAGSIARPLAERTGGA